MPPPHGLSLSLKLLVTGLGLAFLLIVHLTTEPSVAKRMVHNYFRGFRFQEPTAADLARFRTVDIVTAWLVVLYGLASLWSDSMGLLLLLPLVAAVATAIGYAVAQFRAQWSGSNRKGTD